MKNAKTISRLTALLLALVMVFFTLAACDNGEEPTPTPGTDPTPTPPAATVTVAVTATPNAVYISGNETVQLTATVSGSENTAVTYATEPAGYLNVSETGVVSVNPEATLTRNTKVSVIATSVADSTAKASKSFIVKAPVKDGVVGELTSAMLQEIGNMSITVTGKVTDYYQDLLQVTNSYETSYDTFVKMMEGKWEGTWNESNNADKAVTTTYRRNDVSAEVMDENGEWGKPIEMIYIGKDNTMVAEPVKTDRRNPVLWSSQHLWNHLGELDVNRFVQIEDTNRYEFTLDPTNEDEVYFMTYLSYFLTPMMYETFNKLIVTVEGGKITKLTAQTQQLYYVGSEIVDTAKDAESLTYTIAEFVFSDIGTTIVNDPVGFDAPEHADKLTAALEALKGAENYTYSIADVTTRRPVSDSGDYEMASAVGTGSGASMMALLSSTFPYANYRSAGGTIGEVAWVVDGNVIIAKTSKYDYGMDDKLYRTEYTGYKDNGDGTYDSFYYDPDANGFVGNRRYYGNIQDDHQPSFVLSPNIFQYGGHDAINHVYTFILREGAATTDVAKVLSPYSYAKNAEATISSNAMTLKVSEDGQLKSITYSYNINDMYYGYYTISYKNIGTTEYASYGTEGDEHHVFDNYIRREIPTSWSAFTDTSYYYLHTNQCNKYSPTACEVLGPDGEHIGWDHSAHHKTVDGIMQDLFGADAAYIPSPDVFTTAFGDTMSTYVGFNYREGAVANTYIDYVSFNMSAIDYESNDNYYQDAIERIKTALAGLGYTVDTANTNMVGNGVTSDRFISFVKEASEAGAPGVQIVIENNRTAHFFIRIYKAGEWKLSK